MEILGLVKRYGSATAVNGLDLRLESGHTLALLGPNGAGKTTTVEACEGFRRPDAGTVRVLGIDPYSGPRAHADLTARIGVMLQDGGIYPAGRPREVLRLQAALYANPLDPDALLDLLGIAHVANRPFRRLSGGEQQRLSLALALIGRPELVFLDEPTAGLDPHARHTVWDILRDLRTAGVSILLTTHLLDEAEELADHVVIIDRGSVLAAGSPQQLTAVSGTAGPGGAGSASGAGEVRFRAPSGLPIDALQTALPEGCTVTEAPSGHYRITGAVDPQALATVTSWCASRGVMPQDLSVDHRSLEDVFLDLTGRQVRP